MTACTQNQNLFSDVRHVPNIRKKNLEVFSLLKLCRSGLCFSLFFSVVLLFFSTTTQAENEYGFWKFFCSTFGSIEYPPAMSKGSAGVIASDTYVVVSGDHNEVFISGRPERVTWKGGSREQHEIVMTDMIKISKNVEDLDQKNLIIVMFFQDEIRVIKLNESTSFKYNRHPKENQENVSPRQ